MLDICVTFPIFPNMTVSACPACMLFLPQKLLIVQLHQNLVVPQPGSHHSLSYPLPHPPLPLSPQKATPHSRMEAEGTAPQCRLQMDCSRLPSLWVALFFPRSRSPGCLTFEPIRVRIFATILLLSNLLCACKYCTHMFSISLFPSWPEQLSCYSKWYWVHVRSRCFISINVNLEATLFLLGPKGQDGGQHQSTEVPFLLRLYRARGVY